MEQDLALKMAHPAKKLQKWSGQRAATITPKSSIMTTLVVGVPVIGAATAVLTINTPGFNLIFQSIADAYIQVSTFVAITLFIFYGLNKLGKFDAITILSNQTVWQVPIAAGLGALPGCGGAIIVMTQFVSGRLSFGSVVAVLTATMGDAAFLLIAKQPATGLMMIAIGFSAGTLFGWMVNSLHNPDFLRVPTKESCPASDLGTNNNLPFLNWLWAIIMLPAIPISFLSAFQIDTNSLLATPYLPEPTTFLGVVGGTLAASMYFATRLNPQPSTHSTTDVSLLSRTSSNTNFVTVWVIAAFVSFELTIHFSKFDIASLFEGWAVFAPLAGVLLGFIPGCGPQILVTSLYITGIIPLSAQIGNAISNDGDALFPAIAIAPKVAILATLYSAIPALLLSYLWYLFME